MLPPPLWWKCLLTIALKFIHSCAKKPYRLIIPVPLVVQLSRGLAVNVLALLTELTSSFYVLILLDLFNQILIMVPFRINV